MKQNLTILFSLLIIITACSDNSVNDPIIDPVLEAIGQVNQDSLNTHVKILSGALPFIHNGVSTTIPTRNWALEGNVLAGDYIESKLRSYGLEVTNQPFDSLGRNIIATHRGTIYQDTYFIIGAHYDDCGVLNCNPANSSIAPGADDNASGVAAVLEAARILSQYPSKYSLIFALWDEEERGLYGSLHYAEEARNSNMSIAGVINLDMIGWNSDADQTVEVIVWDMENIPELGLKADEINTEYSLGLEIEYMYRDRGSDFVSFWINQYPAISLIEDFNDWNSNYHSTLDTFENLDLQYFYKISKLAIGIMADYAFN